MNVNGTLINYYFHCKRQCYLFGNRLNLEDNSERHFLQFHHLSAHFHKALFFSPPVW